MNETLEQLEQRAAAEVRDRASQELAGNPLEVGGAAAPGSRRHILQAVALVAVLALGGGLLAVQLRSDDQVVTADGRGSPHGAPTTGLADGSKDSGELKRLLAEFRPDIPAREIPMHRRPSGPEPFGMTDEAIANEKWLISTMSEEDGLRSLAQLKAFLGEDEAGRKELAEEAKPGAGERYRLVIPAVGIGWLDHFGTGGVDESTGLGVVYRSSTGDSRIGRFDGEFFFPDDGTEKVDVNTGFMDDPDLDSVRPDLPAEEVPPSDVGATVDQMPDYSIRYQKWLISTMTPEDARRELERLEALTEARGDAFRSLTLEIHEPNGRRLLPIPGLGARWVDAGPDEDSERYAAVPGTQKVYSSSTSPEVVGGYGFNEF